jgi:hypothetical protein
MLIRTPKLFFWWAFNSDGMPFFFSYRFPSSCAVCLFLSLVKNKKKTSPIQVHSGFSAYHFFFSAV